MYMMWVKVKMRVQRVILVILMMVMFRILATASLYLTSHLAVPQERRQESGLHINLGKMTYPCVE